MSRHVPDCDATCVDFADHARHFCCRVCQRQDASPAGSPPPSTQPPPTPPEFYSLWQLRDDLFAELAELRAEVSALQDQVAELTALIAEDVSDADQ